MNQQQRQIEELTAKLNLAMKDNQNTQGRATLLQKV